MTFIPYPKPGSRWEVTPRHRTIQLPRVIVEVLDSGHGSVVIRRIDIPGKHPVAVSIVEWEQMLPTEVEEDRP